MLSHYTQTVESAVILDYDKQTSVKIQLHF
jgi:hypothetical protein